MAIVSRRLKKECTGFVTDVAGNKLPVASFAGRAIRRTRKMGETVVVSLPVPGAEQHERIVFSTFAEYEQACEKILAK